MMPIVTSSNSATSNSTAATPTPASGAAATGGVGSVSQGPATVSASAANTNHSHQHSHQHHHHVANNMTTDGARLSSNNSAVVASSAINHHHHHTPGSGVAPTVNKNVLSTHSAHPSAIKQRTSSAKVSPSLGFVSVRTYHPSPRPLVRFFGGLVHQPISCLLLQCGLGHQFSCGPFIEGIKGR